jgi:hypothetical protein
VVGGRWERSELLQRPKDSSVYHAEQCYEKTL